MNIYGINSEYDKKFNSEVPKKQAKSYEIDLGQNVTKYFIFITKIIILLERTL
jgi:hypothetical protein